MKRLFIVVLLGCCFPVVNAQQFRFTEQDSLRGSITPERAWWDLNFYHLSIAVEPERKFISGSNTIRYTVEESGKILQLDLQPPMELKKVIQDGEELSFESKINAHFIQLKKPQLKGETNELVVFYEGSPKIAKNAPWDGGFSWEEDAEGNPFAATSCQGLGASVWWPNKDHMYDEVDSMAISITVPKQLVAVANGRLRKIDSVEQSKTFHWYVNNPINNYGVNVNLANYKNFGASYEGENGKLDLEYYVLPQNLEKARQQFKQVPQMLEAFEYWFGPYPFYEDSFKLVEVPYLGMEHQSSVTYGNGYQNGYLGYDLSGTGWGLKFDYIIIHEAGHEWFANSITYEDMADMWIHEGFTTYSENLFIDYYYGTEAAAEYVIGTRGKIKNDRPIIAPYEVNQSGSGDMYFKGANMLHTLRQLVEDDALWRQVLRGLNKTFYHQTVTTEQVEAYMSQATGKDLAAFFNQYLRTTMIPLLEYRIEGNTLHYRYTDIVPEFDMPVRVTINEKTSWLFPNAEWKAEEFGEPLTGMVVDPNFYIESNNIGHN
jgi:aminopeptidase N